MPTQSPVQAATEKRFYRPELDALRFVAFLLVFFDHGSGWYRSALASKIGEASRCGLQLFFVLSAYLISELLLREREKTGTVHIPSFFVRRILRIWPLYFCFIGAVYVAARFGHGYFPTSALLSFLTLSGNWWNYAYGFLPFYVGTLWSISVEEQFYLVWPWLVRAGGARALRITVPIVLLCGALAVWYSGHYVLSAGKYWFNGWNQYSYFAVGAVLALLLHKRSFQPSRAARFGWFAAAITAFCLLVFVFPVAETGRNIHTPGLFAAFTLLGVVSVCLFLGFYGLHMGRGSAPFLYLGRISYGLYVFHLFALQACEAATRRFHFHGVLYITIQLCVALMITIVLAALSYRYLETPFLRLKGRFTFVHTRDA